MLTDITTRNASMRPRAARWGSGFVLAVPTRDLVSVYDLWQREGLPVTLEPEDAPWARIFYGLDPDGYELMFEEFFPDERADR
jgi:lactoylglutathione lyase